jgi:hypothetical protein
MANLKKVNYNFSETAVRLYSLGHEHTRLSSMVCYCGFLSIILPREEMCTTFWKALFVFKHPLFLFVFIYSRYVGRTSRQQEILLFTVINCVLCQMNTRYIWAKAQFFVLFLYIYCSLPRTLKIKTLCTGYRLCHAFVLLCGDAIRMQFQLESRSLL